MLKLWSLVWQNIYSADFLAQETLPKGSQFLNVCFGYNDFQRELIKLASIFPESFAWETFLFIVDFL